MTAYQTVMTVLAIVLWVLAVVALLLLLRRLWRSIRAENRRLREQDAAARAKAQEAFNAVFQDRRPPKPVTTRLRRLEPHETPRPRRSEPEPPGPPWDEAPRSVHDRPLPQVG